MVGRKPGDLVIGKRTHVAQVERVVAFHADQDVRERAGQFVASVVARAQILASRLFPFGCPQLVREFVTAASGRAAWTARSLEGRLASGWTAIAVECRKAAGRVDFGVVRPGVACSVRLALVRLSLVPGHPRLRQPHAEVTSHSAIVPGVPRTLDSIAGRDNSARVRPGIGEELVRVPYQHIVVLLKVDVAPGAAVLVVWVAAVVVVPLFIVRIPCPACVPAGSRCHGAVVDHVLVGVHVNSLHQRIIRRQRIRVQFDACERVLHLYAGRAGGNVPVDQRWHRLAAARNLHRRRLVYREVEPRRKRALSDALRAGVKLAFELIELDVHRLEVPIGGCLSQDVAVCVGWHELRARAELWPSALRPAAVAGGQATGRHGTGEDLHLAEVQVTSRSRRDGHVPALDHAINATFLDSGTIAVAHGGAVGAGPRVGEVGGVADRDTGAREALLRRVAVVYDDIRNKRHLARFGHRRIQRGHQVHLPPRLLVVGVHARAGRKVAVRVAIDGPRGVTAWVRGRLRRGFAPRQVLPVATAVRCAPRLVPACCGVGGEAAAVREGLAAFRDHAARVAHRH